MEGVGLHLLVVLVGREERAELQELNERAGLLEQRVEPVVPVVLLELEVLQERLEAGAGLEELLGVVWIRQEDLLVVLVDLVW